MLRFLAIFNRISCYTSILVADIKKCSIEAAWAVINVPHHIENRRPLQWFNLQLSFAYDLVPLSLSRQGLAPAANISTLVWSVISGDAGRSIRHRVQSRLDCYTFSRMFYRTRDRFDYPRKRRTKSAKIISSVAIYTHFTSRSYGKPMLLCLFHAGSGVFLCIRAPNTKMGRSCSADGAIIRSLGTADMHIINQSITFIDRLEAHETNKVL